MTDYEIKLLEMLEKLVGSSSSNNLQKGQCVFVRILQTNGQDQLPSLDEACREFELSCDISPDFFVDGRETPKSIQLKYGVCRKPRAPRVCSRSPSFAGSRFFA
jgi:hypothetical protein